MLTLIRDRLSAPDAECEEVLLCHCDSVTVCVCCRLCWHWYVIDSVLLMPSVMKCCYVIVTVW